jgi:hypothetical protein
LPCRRDSRATAHRTTTPLARAAESAALEKDGVIELACT